MISIFQIARLELIFSNWLTHMLCLSTFTILTLSPLLAILLQSSKHKRLEKKSHSQSLLQSLMIKLPLWIYRHFGTIPYLSFTFFILNKTVNIRKVLQDKFEFESPEYITLSLWALGLLLVTLPIIYANNWLLYENIYIKHWLFPHAMASGEIRKFQLYYNITLAIGFYTIRDYSANWYRIVVVIASVRLLMLYLSTIPYFNSTINCAYASIPLLAFWCCLVYMLGEHL